MTFDETVDPYLFPEDEEDGCFVSRPTIFDQSALRLSPLNHDSSAIATAAEDTDPAKLHPKVEYNSELCTIPSRDKATIFE